MKKATEILVYGLPKGETERYRESLLSTQCKTAQDVERIKEAASKDGWHSFRVTEFDPTKPPDFIAAINTGKRK